MSPWFKIILSMSYQKILKTMVQLMEPHVTENIA